MEELRGSSNALNSEILNEVVLVCVLVSTKGLIYRGSV